MMLGKYFKKTVFRKEHTADGVVPEAPQGILKKCNACKGAIFTEDVKRNLYICPKCGNYFRVHAYRRIEFLLDDGSFEEWDQGMTAGNPLGFPGDEEKVRALQERTGLTEAVVTGKGRINGMETVIGVCDGRFMMASMGEAVGEKITRAVERATKLSLPVILFACSGGARMQEGIVSLMQMAKTSAALKRHSDAGLLYVSVLTDPTTGGVTASWAMLGDIILAEPHALIGFAGPRVIEQTIGQKLPKGFQRAEFLVEHGFVDRILPREEAKEVLAEILRMHGKDIEVSSEVLTLGDGDVKRSLAAPETGEKTSAWDCVQKARKKDRPVGEDYIRELFPDFIEFHGDRLYGDDAAIIGGIASFDGTPVTVIAEAKGADTKENIRRNFGMLIGEPTAELIKMEIGSAFPSSEAKEIEVKGRNLSEGVPRTFTIHSNEVLEALTEPLNQIVGAVKTALEKTPPELGADIAERGMMLTGGGALLRDLDQLLQEQTGLPVHIAEEPLNCVVKGCGIALENIDRLHTAFTYG